MNKIRDGWVFSLVHLTWNDPNQKVLTDSGMTPIWNIFISKSYSQFLKLLHADRQTWWRKKVHFLQLQHSV